MCSGSWVLPAIIVIYMGEIRFSKRVAGDYYDKQKVIAGGHNRLCLKNYLQT